MSEIFIKAAGRAFAVTPMLENPDVERYIFEYGFKQVLADAAAGKSGPAALAAIEARYNRLLEGDIPSRGDRADSAEAAMREVTVAWMRGQCGLSAKQANELAKTPESRERYFRAYVETVIESDTRRKRADWLDDDAARFDAGLERIASTLTARRDALLAERAKKVKVDF